MSDQDRGRVPTDLVRAHRSAVDTRTLQEALGVVRALDHTSSDGAGASLQEVGKCTGHTPVCVARELLHLVFPATHPGGAVTHPGGEVALTEAVRRRWRWPLHELRSHDHQAGTRVWDRVRAPGAAVASPRPRLN